MVYQIKPCKCVLRLYPPQRQPIFVDFVRFEINSCLLCIHAQITDPM